MLILIRHAKAEPKESWSGDDLDRPLTNKGARRFADVADTVSEQADVDVILTSPAKRCLDTAGILSDETGADVEQTNALRADADPTHAAAMLRGRSESVVAVCGHEPMLSALCEKLCGAPLPMPIKKGMAVALDRDGDGPDRFQWAVLPKDGRLVEDLGELVDADAEAAA